MHPRTCSRCSARLDASGVLTVALHRTADGRILCSPSHVCAPCLARETAEELAAARRLADRMIDAHLSPSTRSL